MVSEPILGIIMLSIMVLTIFLGFPTAFTLMALGVLFGFPSLQWHVFDLLVQRTFAVMSNDVLISIPLFMFMGYVMERAGIMDRMFHSYRLLFGPLPGALALTTMVVGTIFGIASGIVGAGVTLMGVLALPPMLRAGYSVSLASGTITASGTLGILIPPSVMLIVYGATAGVSVVKLYAGAFGPGFLLSGLFLLYIVVACLIKPSLGPPLPKAERNVPVSTIAKEVIISSVPITILTVVVLLIIVIGWTTPTEAAALGAFLSLLIAAGYKRLNWTDAGRIGAADRSHHGHGLLAVHRLQPVRCRFRPPRRAAATRELDVKLGPVERQLSLANDVHHLPARLAARVDGDHRHLRADLSAAPEDLPGRPSALRRDGRGESADRLPVAARGDVGLLFEGHRAAARDA